MKNNLSKSTSKKHHKISSQAYSKSVAKKVAAFVIARTSCAGHTTAVPRGLRLGGRHLLRVVDVRVPQEAVVRGGRLLDDLGTHGERGRARLLLLHQRVLHNSIQRWEGGNS